MRFNIFIIPAVAAMASALPAEGPAGSDLFVRDEYRWCLGPQFPENISSKSAAHILNRREDQRRLFEEVQLAHARHRYRKGLLW